MPYAALKLPGGGTIQGKDGIVATDQMPYAALKLPSGDLFLRAPSVATDQMPYAALKH